MLERIAHEFSRCTYKGGQLARQTDERSDAEIRQAICDQSLLPWQ